MQSLSTCVLFCCASFLLKPLDFFAWSTFIERSFLHVLGLEMFRTSAQGNLFSNPKCFRNWLISYQEHSRLVNSLICDLLIALPVDVCRLIGEFAFPCLTDLPKGHMVFKKRKIHVFLKQFFRWYYHLDAVFLEDFVEFLNQVPSRGPQFATYCMSYISATHEEECLYTQN